MKDLHYILAGLKWIVRMNTIAASIFLPIIFLLEQHDLRFLLLYTPHVIFIAWHIGREEVSDKLSAKSYALFFESDVDGKKENL